jgi:hypothetical protein
MIARAREIYRAWRHARILRRVQKHVDRLDASLRTLDAEEQRRSFAYGNAHLADPFVTRQMIDEAAERLALENRNG